MICVSASKQQQNTRENPVVKIVKDKKCKKIIKTPEKTSNRIEKIIRQTRNTYDFEKMKNGTD